MSVWILQMKILYLVQIVYNCVNLLYRGATVYLAVRPKMRAGKSNSNELCSICTAEMQQYMQRCQK